MRKSLGIEALPRRGGERDRARDMDVACSGVGVCPRVVLAGDSFILDVFYGMLPRAANHSPPRMATCVEIEATRKPLLLHVDKKLKLPKNA